MSKEIDLRCGDYREVLADVENIDALICDPPYSARTHASTIKLENNGSADGYARIGVHFASWSPEDAAAFVTWAKPRVRHWMLIMCSHDLWRAYDDAAADADWYTFAPLPIVADTVRMGGDGPASTPAWCFVARRRSAQRFGSTPSHYKDSTGGAKALERGIVGGKSIALMRKIVCDYSRPGWTICDPTAGAGTTAIACQYEGRKFIGSEMDEGRHALALSRIAKHGAQRELFSVT